MVPGYPETEAVAVLKVQLAEAGLVVPEGLDPWLCDELEGDNRPEQSTAAPAPAPDSRIPFRPLAATLVSMSPE